MTIFFQVFVSFESEELSRPETVVEESSTARTTPSSDRKTSMELSITSSTMDRAVGTETPPMAIKKGNSLQYSPDDGMGDSIARGSSTTTETDK